MSKNYLNEEQVFGLFQTLLNKENYAYNEPRSVAHARSVLIASDLRDRDIEANIFVIAANDSEDYSVRLSYTNGPFQESGHVAVCVDVETQSGNVVPMVLDPALFDGPMTVSAYKKALSCKTQKSTIVSGDKFLENVSDVNLIALIYKLHLVSRQGESEQRELLPSPMRLDFAISSRRMRYKDVFEGQTWKTKDPVSAVIKRRAALLNKRPNRPLK